MVEGIPWRKTDRYGIDALFKLQDRKGADLVLAMTGASGAPYAVGLLRVLCRSGRTVHLTVSPSGAQVLREELGIEIFKFENTFFDRKTGGRVSEKMKPANAEPVSVSVTQLREMLSRGELPPAEFTRTEVAQILIDDARRQR